MTFYFIVDSQPNVSFTLFLHTNYTMLNFLKYLQSPNVLLLFQENNLRQKLHRKEKMHIKRGKSLLLVKLEGSHTYYNRHIYYDVEIFETRGI